MKNFKSTDKNLNKKNINKLKENILFKDHPFDSLPLANQKLDEIVKNEKSKYSSLFGEKLIFNCKSKNNQDYRIFPQKNNQKLTKTFPRDKNKEINAPITLNNSNSKLRKYILNAEKQKTKKSISSNSTIDYTKFRKYNTLSRNKIPNNNNKLIQLYSNCNVNNLNTRKFQINKKFYINFKNKISLSGTYNKLETKKNLSNLKLQKNNDVNNKIKQTTPNSTNLKNSISKTNTDNFSLSNNLFFITNINNISNNKRIKTDLDLYEYFFNIKNLEKTYETSYKNLINNIEDGKIEINSRQKKWEHKLNKLNRKNNYEIESVEKLENDEDLKQMVSIQKNFINNFINNFGQKNIKSLSELENNNSKMYSNKYISQYMEKYSKEKINYGLISFKHKNFKKMIDKKRQELIKVNKYVTKLIAMNRNYTEVKRKKTQKILVPTEKKCINKNKTHNSKGLENNDIPIINSDEQINKEQFDLHSE